MARVDGGDVVGPSDIKELFGVSEKEKFIADCLQYKKRFRKVFFKNPHRVCLFLDKTKTKNFANVPRVCNKFPL